MKVLILGRMTIALVACFSLQAQTADTLEVVAIHPSRVDSMNTRIDPQPGGRLVITNATLRTLIRNAYGVLPFQLAREPKWSESDRFDINAKNASGQQITQDSLKPLLQELIADRFHFKAHWETREESVYVLRVENDGPKFQPYAGGLQHGMNTSKLSGKVHMRGSDVPMTDLATNLGNQLQRFVVDETGLLGHYDFLLHWNPDPAEDSVEPSLPTALHEQLGLRLEPRKGPVHMLIIDGAEKPSEN
jgi:uncharacterized protein (TIGR03435 family)